MSTPNPNHPNNVNNQLNSGSSSGKINPLSSQKSVFVGNPHGNNQFNAPSNPPHINQNQQNFQGKHSMLFLNHNKFLVFNNITVFFQHNQEELHKTLQEAKVNHFILLYISILSLG